MSPEQHVSPPPPLNMLLSTCLSSPSPNMFSSTCLFHLMFFKLQLSCLLVSGLFFFFQFLTHHLNRPSWVQCFVSVFTLIHSYWKVRQFYCSAELCICMSSRRRCSCSSQNLKSKPIRNEVLTCTHTCIHSHEVKQEE